MEDAGFAVKHGRGGVISFLAPGQDKPTRLRSSTLGPGFDPEVDRHLRSQMDEILKYSRLPSLELDGMGILNIFIRFYLLFGSSFLFQFGNLPEGGAFVIVGGRFHEKDQTL